MITPPRIKSSVLVEDFDDELRVARIPLTDVERYRDHVAPAEWVQASSLEGKRRVEHLAGRIAAHLALEALIGVSDATIARADDGAPEIRGLDDPPIVSISHGRRTAVAAVGYVDALGIDVCDHEDVMRVRRVVLRFLRDDETALALGGGVARWIALWALKEAAAKALRQGLLDGGLRASCLSSIEPPRFAWPSFDATLVFGASDVIAVAFRR